MYENEVVEMEDFTFNHYLNHFDECDGEHLIYNDEYSSIEAAVECMEEIVWN